MITTRHGRLETEYKPRLTSFLSIDNKGKCGETICLLTLVIITKSPLTVGQKSPKDRESLKLEGWGSDHGHGPSPKSLRA